MSFVRVKGTYDVLPNESAKWQALESYIRSLYKRFNYQEIRTPIMEYSNVFHRESEGSDMVTKETYNFKDKANRDLTLRPEGTAGVIRSYVENKIYAQNGLSKFYYIGQNFRYERPQKGRFRQFMQFGVEAIGADTPLLDAEVISMAYYTVSELGLKEVVVKINSLGDDASKKAYQEALFNYLKPFENELSEDSKIRLYKNPLRILDSKDKGDQKIIKNSPLPVSYLSEKEAKHYSLVKEALDQINIPYEEDSKLVRGLDYYSSTVFEIQAKIEGFGAQNALGGGGRYEHLVKEFGGPDLSGIGYAFGMERILSALEIEGIDIEEKFNLDAYFITFDVTAKSKAFELLNILRKDGLTGDLSYANKSFKSQLKEALSLNAKFLVIIGENELKQSKVQLKNTKTEIQIEVPFNEIINRIKESTKNE